MLIIRSSFALEIPFANAVGGTAYPANTEVPLQVGGNGNINQLINKPIRGIDIITSAQQAYGFSGNAIITPAQAAYVLITLQNVKTVSKLEQMPVTTMISGNNYGFIRELDGVPLNIGKSKLILLANNTINSAVQQSVILNFYYDDYDWTEALENPKHPAHKEALMNEYFHGK